MDFMSDSLASGRPFRLLTIVDQFTRECPCIEVNRSLTSASVVNVLDHLASSYGLPKAITVDNGPEFTSKLMTEWCDKHAAQLQFIKPGKPIENAAELTEHFSTSDSEQGAMSTMVVTKLNCQDFGNTWSLEYLIRNHSSRKNTNEKANPDFVVGSSFCSILNNITSRRT
jgi:putative transposase